MGAKRSQRRSVQYEKDQSGCMWGLISMFDFRHVRSTRKLIADKRHGSKHISGPGISKNKFEVLSNLEENYQAIIDGEESTIVTLPDASNKPSVKKLIEEEMVNEQSRKKNSKDGVVEHKQLETEDENQIKAGNKKTKKTRKKSRDMDIPSWNVAENVQSECSCEQNNADQQSVKDFGIEEIMEEFSHQIHQKGIGCLKDGLNGEVPGLSSERRSDLEEKLRAAIKEFIVQKFTNGKSFKEDQKIQNSNELMNELELLSTNEELFLKLVQDPQSLLVKYVENFKDPKADKNEESKRIGGTELLEQKLVEVNKSEDLANHKHRSFFRRKVKSQERNPVKETEHPDTLNRIVILKPGPIVGVRNSKPLSSLVPDQQSHDIITNKEASERVGSHFFLSEIKRRLKHAMGKQQHEAPIGASDKSSTKHKINQDNEKSVGKSNVGRNSPTKDHFYMERIAKPSSGLKRADKLNKMKESELSKHESDSSPNVRISNIYLEAKKHLSELLSNGDGADLTSRQNPKTLGRILSLPEYNVSPVSSPRRDWEKTFVTARTKFSSQDKCQNSDDNESSPEEGNKSSPPSIEARNLDSQTAITDSKTDHDEQVPNRVPGISDETLHKIEVEEAVRVETSCEDDSNTAKEENVILDSPREPSGSSTEMDDQKSDVPIIRDDKSDSSCLEQDLLEENQLQSSPPESPSSSLITSKVSDLEIPIELPERPSPVSVLEPGCAEDDVMLPNTISQTVKLTIQPLRIQFEEPDSPPTDEAPNAKGFANDKDASFAYVKAVIQALGFNWDEACIKLLSSDQLIDPSLVDEVEFFSNQLCCDQKLIFDCINEVLVEVCQYYFGSSPWVSFTKPSIAPSPDTKTAIREVSKGVFWHLLQPPLPRTLDQIVGKDMARTGTWLDARFDAETIGFDMGEAILEDLMEDTILSYADESCEGDNGIVLESEESELLGGL